MPPLLDGMISFLGIRSRSGAAVSDDEGSDVAEETVESVGSVEIPAEATTKKESKRRAAAPVEKAKNDEMASEDVEGEEVEDDEGEAEEPDEEIEEGLYVVETIKSHLVTDDGQIMFHVKWEGYERRSDMTWEPEDHLLGSAEDILSSYLIAVGGREKILHDVSPKPEPKKKRARTATIPSTPDASSDGKSNGKRARKTARHPASATPPASITKAAFKPPTGSWEDEVQGIDACEGTDGSVMVFLQWRTGQKTQHPLEQVYKRCPQKMLKFYERHLSFTLASRASEPSTDVVIESSKKDQVPARTKGLKIDTDSGLGVCDVSWLITI